MDIEIIRVMERDWDYLIVLDACRYDYFEKLYQQYFTGELGKGLSPGSNTVEWITKSFPVYYSDVIYISGNPYINSKVKIKGFDSKKHFHKIIDVWDFGWSDELGTVHPIEVNKASLSTFSSFKQMRFIIHYLQPHTPFISTKYKTAGFSKPEPRRGYVLQGRKGSIGHKILSLARYAEPIFADTAAKKKIKVLWSKFQTMQSDVTRYGRSELREAYRENLRIVLEHVMELCREILSFDPHSNIVITSDHGELLGENGKIGHSLEDAQILQLFEIPWFEVKSLVNS